jgi:hypothetical protein
MSLGVHSTMFYNNRAARQATNKLQTSTYKPMQYFLSRSEDLLLLTMLNIYITCADFKSSCVPKGNKSYITKILTIKQIVANRIKTHLITFIFLPRRRQQLLQ